MVHSFRIETARAPLDSVHFVVLRYQQFGQIGAILPGNAGDERSFAVCRKINCHMVRSLERAVLAFVPRHIYQFDRVALLLQSFSTTWMSASGELPKCLHISANETVQVGFMRLESKTPANRVVACRCFVVALPLRVVAPPLSSRICCVILASHD